MKMKQNIFFTFAGLFLAVIVFTTARQNLCDQKNTASSTLSDHVLNKSLPEQDSISEALSSYSKLPYKELIFPTKKLRSSHAPSIVELPNGELFAVWYAETPLISDVAIWGSRRPVDAHEWTTPSVIHNTSVRADKNPVLYLDKDKKLWLFWAVEKGKSKLWRADTLRMKISKDFGHTWGEAYNFGTPPGVLPRTHPIRLHNGWVIFPLYVDWNTSSAVVISKDGGLTWGRLKYVLPLMGTQPTVIQRSDLSLFALMRSGMWPRQSWQAVSKNFGDDWKSYRVSGVKNPGSSLEMIKLRNGHVVLVFNDSKKNRSNLSIALSYDEGKSWAHVKAIENKPGHNYSYPSIAQDRLGLIHVLYSYDNLTNIAHFVTNEQWIEK